MGSFGKQKWTRRLTVIDDNKCITLKSDKIAWKMFDSTLIQL